MSIRTDDTRASSPTRRRLHDVLRAQPPTGMLPMAAGMARNQQQYYGPPQRSMVKPLGPVVPAHEGKCWKMSDAWKDAQGEFIMETGDRGETKILQLVERHGHICSVVRVVMDNNSTLYYRGEPGEEQLKAHVFETDARPVFERVGSYLEQKDDGVDALRQAVANQSTIRPYPVLMTFNGEQGHEYPTDIDMVLDVPRQFKRIVRMTSPQALAYVQGAAYIEDVVFGKFKTKAPDAFVEGLFAYIHLTLDRSLRLNPKTARLRMQAPRGEKLSWESMQIWDETGYVITPFAIGTDPILWRNTLEGLQPVEYAADRSRPSVPKYEEDRTAFLIDAIWWICVSLSIVSVGGIGTLLLSSWFLYHALTVPLLQAQQAQAAAVIANRESPRSVVVRFLR